MSNDVAELKQYVLAHASSQNLAVDDLLAAIRTDGDGPGSWTWEWVRAGEERERAGDLLGAVQHYNLARFPFVDGQARLDALARCVRAFDRWRADVPGIERLDVDLPGGRVSAWTIGLSTAERRPVLVMSGGIVSIKEQWAPVLAQLDRYGFAGVVTEMPGVGENTVCYNANSHLVLPALLNAIADRADVSRTYALALSFSGHLALKAAPAEPRLRGIVGAGAPVRHFFTDRDWQARVPRITVDTLAHLTGRTPDAVFDHIRGWGLDAAHLAAVRVPVAYVASGRDEIIPAADPAFLRAHAPDVRLIEHDDVHGSPAHFAHTRLWTLAQVLRISGAAEHHRAPIESALAELGGTA